MLRAILFDLGGTLDSDGEDWLTRFQNLYAAAERSIAPTTVRGAFDHAERLAAADEGIRSIGLDDMLARHVAWQLEFLGLSFDRGLHEQIVSSFSRAVRAAATAHRTMLGELKTRGFRLGVVSNGCGNVDVLCGDLGYLPFLTLIIDSARVGVAKP